MDSLMGGKLEYGKLKTMCERNAIQWWDEISHTGAAAGWLAARAWAMEYSDVAC